jgi:AAA+ superfamily predicted ATPase
MSSIDNELSNNKNIDTLHEVSEEEHQPTKRVFLSSSDLNNLSILVYEKIKDRYKKKDTRKAFLTNVILKIIVLSVVIASLIFFLTYMSKKLKIQEDLQEDNFREFDFKPASDFENAEYYTKEDLLDYIVSYITKIVYEINNLDKKILSKKLNSTQKNFLFKGPPGTGKTHFIKKMAFLLDINLKMYKLKTEVGKSKYKEMSMMKVYNMIKKKKSVVSVLFLSPSIIENKFVGESEKIIQQIFSYATKSSDMEAVIIFFDEMDAFFGNRNQDQHVHEIKKQTELLNLIGGALDKLETKLFLFGATNRLESLDKAFLRRFANKFLFDRPSVDEFYILLHKHTKKWVKSCNRERILQSISENHGTNGFSHSEIIELVSKIALICDINDEECYVNLKFEFDNFVRNNDGIANSKYIIPSSLKEHLYYSNLYRIKSEDKQRINFGMRDI